MPTKKDTSKSHVNIREKGDDTFKATYHDAKGKPTHTKTRHMADSKEGWGSYESKGAFNANDGPHRTREPGDKRPKYDYKTGPGSRTGNAGRSSKASSPTRSPQGKTASGKNKK
jgi:hypothetical protein